MKTAISLPDSEFERIERVVRKYGMTRSEFYRRAVKRYADELDDTSLTSEIDAAIRAVGQPGDDTLDVRRAANARLTSATDEHW